MGLEGVYRAFATCEGMGQDVAKRLYLETMVRHVSVPVGWRMTGGQ